MTKMGVETDTDEHPELSAGIVLGEAFPGVFNLVYVDADHEQTRRTIEQCHLAEYEGSHYLSAFCRLRQAGRLFRFDRIAEMTNADTGEVLTEVLGNQIGGAAASGRSRLKELAPDLGVLVFVATLSAGMRDSQIALIVAYLTAQGANALASSIKRYNAPNPVAFREFLKQVPAERVTALRQAAVDVLAKTKRNADLDRGVIQAIDKWTLPMAALNP